MVMVVVVVVVVVEEEEEEEEVVSTAIPTSVNPIVESIGSLAVKAGSSKATMDRNDPALKDMARNKYTRKRSIASENDSHAYTLLWYRWWWCCSCHDDDE